MTCACGCGQELVRRPKERPAKFAKRRLASLSCAARVRHRDDPSIRSHLRKGTSSPRRCTAPMSHEQIAAALGISESLVQQIEAEALAKLRAQAEGWR